MKILLASEGLPLQMGGITFLYYLGPLLAKEGIDVRHATFVNSRNARIYKRKQGASWYDPLGIGSQLVVDMKGQRELMSWNPDLIITKTCRLASLSGRFKGRAKVLYMTSVAALAHSAVKVGLDLEDWKEWLRVHASSQNAEFVQRSAEAKALKACDIVIVHSHETLEYLEILYPRLKEKIAGPIYTCFLSRPPENYRKEFKKRSIDILMVTSDWNDPTKNGKLMAEICEKLGNRYRIHVAGKFAGAGRTKGGFFHGTIPREEVFALMGNSRLVIAPAFYDPAPNVIVEAIYSGCNILVSRNCGNAHFFPDRILPCLDDAESIFPCIDRSLRRSELAALPFCDTDIMKQLISVFSAAHKGELPAVIRENIDKMNEKCLRKWRPGPENKRKSMKL